MVWTTGLRMSVLWIVVAAAVAASGCAVMAQDAPADAKHNQPAVPALDELPLQESVSQHGITWTFDKPARVGRFVNGDYYVVGPATVKAISPAPADGRNGSTLNIPIVKGKSESKLGFDDRIPHGRYDAKLFQQPSFAMKAGDVLFSSISFEKVEAIRPMVPRAKSHVSKEHSPVRTVAVLTCLAAPAPTDAFRPGYSDPKRTIHLARHLRRDLLPKLASPGNVPDMAEIQRWFERPWTDIVMDEFGAPPDNMPLYGQEFTRAVALATLTLALDMPQEKKETLLVRVVQAGIDMWGLLEAGKSGWPALGGHGNGRKWLIIFTGMMLGNEKMQHPYASFPEAVFSEDLQTMFDDCWTGAKVVYAGHVGPKGMANKVGWGRYEHLHPSKWEDKIGESYRRCCTSLCWVGEALGIQLYGAEKLWDHDSFLVYCDRWMTEDDSKFIRIVKEAGMGDYDNDWSRQGMVWDPFVESMWNKYRPSIKAPVDRWKQPHGGKSAQ
ncbi:MAG: hypothetical protein JXL80_08160 [Planctomycetes bacterium]|nr:hypothetical protein [Planctomycetota bacterium]